MKPIFSRNDHVDKMAFLNWRVKKDNEINNILILADGYLSSSIKLAKLCLIYNRDKTADVVIFPILTNANHGIELYLKAISWMINLLMRSEKRIEKTHNIKQIFQSVKLGIKAYKGNVTEEDFSKAMMGLEAYIDELFDKIQASPKRDNMDFSRYPFSNSYESHFYVSAVGNVEVDLENFVSRFEDIKTSLENLSSYLFENELTDDHFM